MADAWPIEWFRCMADDDDVLFAKKEGRIIKFGSELWRVPRSIGPISIDHDHWSKLHLTLTAQQAVIISNLPIYLTCIRRLKLNLDKMIKGYHLDMNTLEMYGSIPSLPRLGWDEKGE